MFFQSAPKFNIVVFNDEMVAKWKAEYQRLFAWQESDNGRHPALSAAVAIQREINRTNYTAAEKFLAKLRQTPQLLYNQFRIEIIKLLKNFNINFPAGQSVTVRKALFKLHHQLMHNVQTNNLHDAQNHFINLCRLLWLIHKQLIADNQSRNYVFHAFIVSIIESTHISIDGSLPNELASFRLDCQTEIMPTYLLLEKEKREYLLQAQELKRQITFLQNLSDNSFTQARCDLASQIVNESDDQFNRPDFDIKLGATILENTRMLLQQPLNEDLQETYAKLADHVTGCPTSLKLLSGMMLAFFGAALVLASLSMMMTAGFMFLVPTFTTIVVGSSAIIAGSAILACSEDYLRRGGRQGFSMSMFKLSQFQAVTNNMQDDPSVDTGLFRPS